MWSPFHVTSKARHSERGDEMAVDGRFDQYRPTMAPRKEPKATRKTKPVAARAQRRSAALPSPFPPIAEYAFLSNCHTGALVAPDGAVDWLCVPRFDSASVFGSLLDRGAGMFRFAPFGINVPTSRAYVPGTNVLETVVEDAIGLGGGA